MTSDAIFEGPNGDFALSLANLARQARNATTKGKPWPEMSERDHIAAALVLGDNQRLKAANAASLNTAIQLINEDLTSPLTSLYEAEQFFFAVRARVDEETYASFWDQAPQDPSISLTGVPAPRLRDL